MTHRAAGKPNFWLFGFLLALAFLLFEGAFGLMMLSGSGSVFSVALNSSLALLFSVFLIAFLVAGRLRRRLSERELWRVAGASAAFSVLGNAIMIYSMEWANWEMMFEPAAIVALLISFAVLVVVVRATFGLIMRIRLKSLGCDSLAGEMGPPGRF
ncbi:hypothetical protein [Algicella marina]|uniref:Uncharacterized protein n=1 Tax=Algicella marina TaxID=2683284 RepID=A0A6P1SYT8_9RHOB|nr:hypothetical protein [Algicella marina]QHQ34641.1 hypothetical protein GO499_05265 [Algicella marina]